MSKFHTFLISVLLWYMTKKSLWLTAKQLWKSVKNFVKSLQQLYTEKVCQNDTFSINILSNFWICTARTDISGSGSIFFDIKRLPTVQRICQKCLQRNQNFRQNTVWTKKWFRLELVSMELNHTGVIAWLFPHTCSIRL